MYWVTTQEIEGIKIDQLYAAPGKMNLKACNRMIISLNMLHRATSDTPTFLESRIY